MDKPFFPDPVHLPCSPSRPRHPEPGSPDPESAQSHRGHLPPTCAASPQRLCRYSCQTVALWPGAPAPACAPLPPTQAALPDPVPPAPGSAGVAPTHCPAGTSFVTPMVQCPWQGCRDSLERAVQAPTLAPSSPQHGCPSHSLGLKPAGEAVPRGWAPSCPSCYL